MRFNIDWASLIVESKFAIFALCYFVFGGNFPSTSPRGAYIWRGDLTEGYLRYGFGGLIFGGAYFWNFTVPLLTFLCQGKMFHHHDGELIYTLHEDHHRTSVGYHFHGECPKKKINLPYHECKTALKQNLTITGGSNT